MALMHVLKYAVIMQTYLPVDLRVKKTRAIRRRLTKEQVRVRQ